MPEWYKINEEAGVEIQSDPKQDAKEAEAKRKNRKDTPQTITRGVTRVGGGDHGKHDKGVKIIGK